MEELFFIEANEDGHELHGRVLSHVAPNYYLVEMWGRNNPHETWLNVFSIKRMRKWEFFQTDHELTRSRERWQETVSARD